MLLSVVSDEHICFIFWKFSLYNVLYIIYFWTSIFSQFLFLKKLNHIILVLVDVKWVFSKTVKEVLTTWRGPFVGKKRKKVWKSIPLCIFWTVWKERNKLTFRGGVLNIQKLKNFFVCNLWSWAKVYLGEESFSLIGFLEWVAST